MHHINLSDLNGGINGGEAPAFDQVLVGKLLEVLWPYTDKATGKRVLIWASGRVVRVADGLTDKRSPRAQTVLPARRRHDTLGVGRRPRV